MSTHDRIHAMAERLWAEILDEFDGNEYHVGLVVGSLWEKKIKYHLQCSPDTQPVPETKRGEATE